MKLKLATRASVMSVSVYTESLSN